MNDSKKVGNLIHSLARWKIKYSNRNYLELDGFLGEWDAYKDDAEHGNSSVPLPMLGPAVWSTCQTPYLRPKISSMSMLRCSSHFAISLPLFFWNTYSPKQNLIGSGKNRRHYNERPLFMVLSFDHSKSPLLDIGLVILKISLALSQYLKC